MMSKHLCHFPSCDKEVPPKMWGCSKHWYKLPQSLRNKIWRAYRPGQEITKTPSKEYLAVMAEVDEWLRETSIEVKGG